MDRICIWVLFLSLFLLHHVANAEEEGVKRSLINFLAQLSSGNELEEPSWGWNMSSDPCTNGWKGVTCDSRLISVKKIVLDGLKFTGTLDANSLCTAHSLTVLSLKDSNLDGKIPEEIGNCKQLTHLLLSGNKFSGILPDSLSSLNNLKKLEISNNNLSGIVPDLSRISGLVSFLVENNQLSGEIPKLEFSNLQLFNVSFNNFSGAVPDLNGSFALDSVMGNPSLCGEPLPNQCPPSPSWKKGSKGHLIKHVLMYSGYIVVGMVFVTFIAFKLISKNKTEEGKVKTVKPREAEMDSINKNSTASSEYKTGMSKSEYSIISAENSMISSSLVVLRSPVVQGLRFEDLLKAPAELLGKGRHGSLYKVILDDGMALAVKRIKDWTISGEDFKKRMQKIDQVKHPNVLPPIAFYCSKIEKLIVYGYQQNGSLSRLLQGTQNGETFDWGSRLNVATTIAQALAFMHKELHNEGIAHGNLKSSNIMLNKNMDPCISEYGLMVMENKDHSYLANNNGYKTMDQGRDRVYSTFKVDMYGFGVILLELLTGKLVQNDGFDLARWVHSVVSEEWTAEVFDRALINESASEERMVNLLQVALKCTNTSPEARPSMNQVAVMLNSIKEEEEKSIISEA